MVDRPARTGPYRPGDACSRGRCMDDWFGGAPPSALGFDRQHLLESSPMARLAAEFRRQERLGAIDRRLRTDDARPQDEHVHVVVLHALMCGVRIVADGCADAAHLAS